MALFSFALPNMSFAQEETRRLIIKDNTETLPMAPYMARIRDTKSQMTSRKAMEAYERGDAIYLPYEQTKLEFGVDGTPIWFVLNIRNESHQEEFVFSLIKDLFHTQGVIENAILYGADNEDREVSVKINSSYSKVNIPRNKDITLLFYINPADYIPLVLTPYISSEGNFFILQDAHKDGARAALFLFLGVGLAAFLVYVFRSVRFLPHFLAYCAFGAFIISAKYPIIAEGFTEVLHPFLLFLMMSFMAVGTFLQYSISLKDKSELFSVGLPYGLMILSGVILFFLPEGFGLMNIILMIIPSILFCFSFVVLALAFYQDGYKSCIWTGLAWLFTALTLILFLANGFHLFVSFEYFPLSMSYVTLKAAIIFLFLSILTTRIDNNKQQLFDFSVLPTSMKDLKEAEEEGEYNRLLTVVERERQMMGELRQIDARRRKDMQKAKESADEANRAKSAFLAVISHEIRTPMTGIMGLVRLLMETPLSDDQKKYAKSIMESGESMTMLLNDILDFEKIETGKMTLEENIFNIKDVVQSTATLMAGHAQNKKIYLTLEISPEAPLNIKGDASRLRQVLLNLLGNAIKFTEEGGVTIKIRPSKRLLPSEESGTGGRYPFAIAIEDTGIGIPKAALEDLFNPFSQADQSISGKYGGSGLGLAICQRLVELMGGEITVESQEGKGSRFAIHLLVEADVKEGGDKRELERINYTKVDASEADVQNDLPVSEEEDISQAGSLADNFEEIYNPNALKILVVEDNLVSQQVIESFLKKLGHDVTACNNAEDALILAKEENFDLVFMDWELPGMSGPDAIREIKNDTSLFIKNAVLLTGHRVTIEETGLTEDQLSGILNKPVMPEHLEEIIKKLDQEALEQEDVQEEEIRPIETPPPSSPSAEVTRTMPMKKAEEEDGKPTSWSYKESLKEEKPLILQQLEEMGQEEEAENAEPEEQQVPEEKVSEEPAPEPSQSVWESDFFDQAMINSLLETLGEDKVRELLNNVFEKTDEILIDLQAALQANDLQEIKMRTHELKGMSANFALSRVGDLCEALEEDIKTKAGADADNLLMKIQKAHLQAKETLQSA